MRVAAIVPVLTGRLEDAVGVIGLESKPPL